MNSPAGKTDRDRVLLKLREQGIECQAYFPAIHRQAYLAGNSRAPLGPLFRTESASDRCIALPFFSSATEQQIEFVSETLARILEETLGAAAQAPRVFTAATSLHQ
jgi:perosamine synthetase